MCLRTHSVLLRVEQAQRAESYRDFARIHFNDRGGLKKGQVCLLSVNKKAAFVILRGSGNAGEIRLDLETRARLDLKLGQEATFKLTPMFVIGDFLWAWRASDPAYRIAARLGILSLVLGLIGLILGAWSIYLTVFPN